MTNLGVYRSCCYDFACRGFGPFMASIFFDRGVVDVGGGLGRSGLCQNAGCSLCCMNETETFAFFAYGCGYLGCQKMMTSSS